MARRRAREHKHPLAALVLAWIVPGAGHVYVGRPVRGAVICITIACTFWMGMAIGGVMTVDAETERWWFVADAFTGVHGLVAWRMSQRIYDDISARLNENAQYARDIEQLRIAGRGRISREDFQTLRQPYVAKMLQDKDNGLALVHPGEIVARAYAGVAGLLNMLCIFDAVILAMMGKVDQTEQPVEHRRREKDQRQPT